MSPPFILRWLTRVAIGATALIVLLAVAATVFVRLPAAQSRIAVWAVKQIVGSDQTVTVGETRGSWPFSIVLSHIRAADTQGPWLDIDQAELHLRVAA